MTESPLNQAVRTALLRLQEIGTLSDAQLLEGFAIQHEEAAFEQLVRRHGPMVLRVCQRILHNSHDADDAFQATFIVLARKAGSVARRQEVANWLYGVAQRVAWDARRGVNRRQAREELAAASAQGSEASRNSALQFGLDLRSVLDEELERLPAKYRAPVVLCYLEGKTNDEAAQLLRCSRGKVAGTLSRARDLLRDRLARRGLALPASGLAILLAKEATVAAVPSALLTSTVKGGALLVAGEPAAGLLSGQACELADAVLRASTARRMTLAGTMLAMTLLGTGGLVWLGYSRLEYQVSKPTQETTGGAQTYTEGPAFPQHALRTCVAFSGDGKLVASGGGYGIVRLCDAATGVERATFASRGFVYAVAISPNDQIVAAASMGQGIHTVQMWDIATSGEVMVLHPEKSSWYGAFNFSPDGKNLVSGGHGYPLKIWEVDSGKDLSVPRNIDTANKKYAISADGKQLVTCHDAGLAIVYDLATGQRLGGFGKRDTGQMFHPFAVTFSSDGTPLVAGIGVVASCVKVYNVTTEKEVASIPIEGAHSYRILVVPMAFSRDAKKLAVAKQPQASDLLVYNLEKGIEETCFRALPDEPIYSLEFSPDGQSIAVGGMFGTVKVWHSGTKK
jgi:RNA polymerase sigma factor (sigma-70 family)